MSRTCGNTTTNADIDCVHTARFSVLAVDDSAPLGHRLTSRATCVNHLAKTVRELATLNPATLPVTVFVLDDTP